MKFVIRNLVLLLIYFSVAISAYVTNAAGKCGKCSKDIYGRYKIKNHKIYHQDCKGIPRSDSLSSDDLSDTSIPHDPTECSACSDPLKGSYLSNSWGQKFHEKHKKDCEMCWRVISKKSTDGSVKHDGRHICNICYPTTPKGENEIEDSRKRVLEKLESLGFEGLKDEIVPIEIVNRREMRKLSKRDSDGVLGLATSVGGGGGIYINGSSPRNSSSFSKSNYAIYMLSGQPIDMFDAVLAHEYIHIWQFVNNLKYPSSITEGFANLGCLAMYEDQNTQFSKLKLEAMDKDPDPDYGKGYRRMKKCLRKKGWDKLIDDVGVGNARRCRH